MKRTLAEFARACGGELRGRRSRLHRRVHRHAHAQGGRTVRRAARTALQRQRFRRGRRDRRRRRRGGRHARRSPAARRSWCATRRRRSTRAAAAWRAQFSMPLVGVAGSNGKTTVKEMIAAILERRGPTLATRGNLNNHIGVPLTLFRLEPAHRHAVIEIGANHPGEVAALVELARPDGGADHQRRRRTPRRLRQHRRCGARRGRDGRGPRRRPPPR